ncbi:MAG: ABC transporter substrate-binding protein [Betaproteobacteria bacterium]|nr:ABC transporter substrate-binding protein [Betaproteobacteria bacterium]
MLIRFALLALGAVTLAQAQSLAPIKVGVSGPFTGGSSPMGVSMRDAVRLATKEINEIGGVEGRLLELVERDDQADPELGVKVSRELVEKEKVVATLGFINTGVALAAQKVYQDARIPVINNVSTGAIITRQFVPPKHPHNYVFRNSAGDLIQAEMIVADTVDRRRLTKVAIFHDTTPYGQQGREMLEKFLAQKNVKAVAVESFNIGDRDMKAQLARARAAGAQILLTYGIGPELAALANDRATMGWKVPITGSWTLSLANFIDAAGRNADGARMPQTFIEEANNLRRTAFIIAYHRSYGVKRMASAVSAAQGYDSVWLLYAALRQAKSTEGEKLRAALEDLHKPIYGVITSYHQPFNAKDHEAITLNMPVMGEVRGGRVVYAYDEDERKSLLERKKLAAN